jgi:hypothetical protein
MTALPLRRERVEAPIEALPEPRGLLRGDIGMGVLAFFAMMVASWVATGMLDTRFLTHEAIDLWFEADIARVFENMTERWSDQHRAQVHPTFTLFVLPVVHGLQTILSVDGWTATRILLAVAAGFWALGLHAVLRLTSCRRMDAFVFTLLGATSAGAMFWIAIPETHTVAALTIIAALLVVAVSAHRRVPALVEVAVGAAALGVTVTNWMAGILASWSHRPWRQALQISVNALAATVMLWAIGKKLTPSAPFFLGNPPEQVHILAPEALGPVRVISSFFMHSVVMPAIAVVDRPGAGDWPIMTVQSSVPGSAGLASLVAVVLWVVLLGVGLWSLWRDRDRPAMRLFVATFLAGQLALHLLYGNETFLYAPNFLPAFIVLVAFGALGPHRRLVVPLAALLALTNAVSNGRQWRNATRFFVDQAPYHHDYAATRAARPDDQWPDRSTFSRLSMPGTRNFDVGYVSAGGSFSPGIDQFTVSLWVRDQDRLILNSDTWQPVGTPGGTKGDSLLGRSFTPHYDVQWRPDGPRKYRMELNQRSDLPLTLMVRSIGPNSAPVRHLSWSGSMLTINRRWVIETDSSPMKVHLVDENKVDWKTSITTGSEISVVNGWAAARLEWSGPGRRHSLVVRDLLPERSIDRPLGVIPRTDRVSGQPDN